jgi:hypothetical protein
MEGIIYLLDASGKSLAAAEREIHRLNELVANLQAQLPKDNPQQG